MRLKKIEKVNISPVAHPQRTGLPMAGLRAHKWLIFTLTDVSPSHVLTQWLLIHFSYIPLRGQRWD
jgi:hypothetical protein